MVDRQVSDLMQKLGDEQLDDEGQRQTPIRCKRLAVAAHHRSPKPDGDDEPEVASETYVDQMQEACSRSRSPTSEDVFGSVGGRGQAGLA